MRWVLLGMVVAAMASGCGSEEVEKPNPLEKADVPLPVVTMPMGHYPSKLEKSSRPILKEKPIVRTEIAVEGLMEVANPETFQPREMFVTFVEERGDGRVTFASDMGGMPVPVQGNQFQYRTTIVAPAKARRFVLEVYQGEELVTAAHIQVVEAKKEAKTPR